MSELPKETLELPRGYVDADGKHHRRITLRAPTLQDEIESEKLCAQLGASATGSAGWLTLAFRCIVSWEGIPRPELKHVLALTRAEGTTLVEAMQALESKITRLELGNETSNPAPTS